MKSILEVPNYGDLSSAGVVIKPAFQGSMHFLIGRIAVRHTAFPQSVATDRSGIIMGAAAGFESAKVRVGAFAELVERISGFLVAYESTQTVQKSMEQILEDGNDKFINPNTLRHFASWQRLEPFLDDVTSRTPITWCEGYRPLTGETILVPALITFLQWLNPNREPIFLKPDATGIAAHTDQNQAIQKAILEVIERHALMMSWRVLGWPVYPLDNSFVSKILLDICKTLDLTCRLYLLGSPDLPPTILALVSRLDFTELTCGSACGMFNPDLVGKAICEALMLQWTIRYSNVAHDSIKKSFEAQEEPKTSLDHIIRAFYKGKDIAEWYHKQSNQYGERGYSLNVISSAKSEISINLADLERLLGMVVVANVTDSTARSSGWHVYRAIIPGARRRESDYRIAYFGGPYIDPDGRQGMGVADSLLLNYAPHPFG